MNLLAKKIGTGILGMLVLFLACEDPSDIGLILTPDDQTGLFFKELPVTVNTTLIDKIDTETTGGLTGLVGVVDDPDFGKLKSTLHAQFGPERLRGEGEVIANPDNDTTTFLSAKLKMEGNYFRSVDFDQDQIFRIYRVFEDLDIDTRYFSSDTLDKRDPNTMMPELIGERTFTYIPRTDTANVLELDIDLEDAYGMEILSVLQDGSDSTFTTLDKFLETFKGVSIVPDENNTAIFGFNFGAFNNFIELSWTELQPDGDTDTLTFELPFFLSLSSLLAGFSSYEIDRTGTLLQDLDFQEDLANDNGMVFVQGGSGVSMRVGFDSVFAFVDTFELLQINRAELYIDNIQEYQGGQFQFNGPDFLQYIYSDSTNLFITSFDSMLYSDDILESIALEANDLLVPEPFAGGRALAVKQADNTYSTVLTLNLQLFIDNPDVSEFDQDFLILPQAYRDDFSRFIANKDDIRFRIYYTTLRE